MTISAHSPKTKGKSITAFLKRKSTLPGVPQHKAGKWLQIDNSPMAGRNYTVFRVKEPEPAISSAQLGTSLLSDSTDRIKGCRVASELGFASHWSCQRMVLLSQGLGLSLNRCILAKKLLMVIKPRNPVASSARAGYFQTPLESSQTHSI